MMGAVLVQHLIVLSLTLSAVLTQVTISPFPAYTSVPGGSASFLCSISTRGGDNIASIHWLLNETLLENHELSNAEAELINGRIGRLRLTNIFQDLNATRIKCRVEFQSGRVESLGTAALLLIQGNLSVGSLNITTLNSTLYLTWTAPVTLDPDVTLVNPDITYCVDVVNFTSSSTLHSECGINVTEFNFPTTPDTDCHIYTFALRPVAQVGYGETIILSYLGTEEAPEVVFTSHSSISSMIRMSAPVCSGELTFVDVDTEGRIILDDDDLTITDNTITFTTNQLTASRHYNVSVVARNVAGSITSHTETSSHAITGAAIIETEHNTLVITIRYFEHSSAGGALLVFISTESEVVDFTKSVMLTVQVDRETDNYTLQFNFSRGQYQVFVYDVDQDGTLSSSVGYPAVRNQLVISKSSQGISFQPGFSLIESCHINTSFLLIWAECTYPVNSIVAGFQMTAQLRNSSQVHKLFSGKATSPQTSVAIAVEENGIYQVSIIGIRRGTGIVESEVEHVQMVVVNDTTTDITAGTTITVTSSVLIGIGIALGILMLLVIILCGVVIAQWRCNRTLKTLSVNSTKIEMDLSKDAITIAGGNQLYAEIRDPEPSHSATQNVVTPPSVPAPRGPTSPYYEDVDVPKSGGDYQLTQCDAYGVH